MKARFVVQRLKSLGKDASWLAERCGSSEFTMKRMYLKGKVPPKAVLMLMAQALDCKVEDLVYQDELVA